MHVQSAARAPHLQLTQDDGMSTSRPPRPQVMKLTECAAERIKALAAERGSETGALRLGIKKGGCAGMEYTVEWAAKQDPLDEVVEQHGAKVLIDPMAVMYLLGAEMDYRIDKLSAQFVFTNPNQTGACGCGESVNLAPVAADKLEGLQA
jgi:iron-sulfur cluster assembly protein